MLVDTWCADRAPADSCGDLAALEVAEEFLPFGVGGHAVFVGGPHGSPSGQERQVCLDGLVGVDSFLAHGDVDIAVAGDHLGDMRWQPAHDRVGDEQPSEIMGRESQWLTGCWVGQAGANQCGGENVANDVRADPAALGAESSLEQQRRWWQPYAFLPVVGGDQWDLVGVVADPVE